MKRFYKFALMSAFVCLMSACQTTQSVSAPKTSDVAVVAQPKFSITGKIGVTTLTDEGKQAGSAFYAWGQDGERFAIDLTGALGIGATSIRFDGKEAVLMSEKTGTISADTPEELLTKATGWHAPISQLPHWIMGQSAPSDENQQIENNQLIKTNNGEWTANFEYANALPSRLIITHAAGHRVAITITHAGAV